MGRPNDCDCRCGGVDPPQPPVTDCENLLCVVFMDENSPGIPDAKMQGFIDAFPNRVLIVLDVRPNIGPPYMTYTTKFINHPRAFSLRLEWEDNPANLIEFMDRDDGRVSVAETNDPWGRIKTILARNGLTSWLENDNKEVSIFIDNSGSMRVSNVAATVAKLETDLEADGKTRTESIYNGDEDIICPFVVSECCTGPDAETLAGLCGYTWDCPTFVEIKFADPDGFAGPYDYQVRVDGTIYNRGDTILREVGEVVTFELVGGGPSCAGGFTIYGPWQVKDSGETVFQDTPDSLSRCTTLLEYTVPAGGFEIFPEINCAFA
jgi:hypothetical protein